MERESVQRTLGPPGTPLSLHLEVRTSTRQEERKKTIDIKELTPEPETKEKREKVLWSHEVTISQDRFFQSRKLS